MLTSVLTLTCQYRRQTDRDIRMLLYNCLPAAQRDCNLLLNTWVATEGLPYLSTFSYNDQHSPAPLWLFNDSGVVYECDNLLTYLTDLFSLLAFL